MSAETIINCIATGIGAISTGVLAYVAWQQKTLISKQIQNETFNRGKYDFEYYKSIMLVTLNQFCVVSQHSIVYISKTDKDGCGYSDGVVPNGDWNTYTKQNDPIAYNFILTFYIAYQSLHSVEKILNFFKKNITMLHFKHSIMQENFRNEDFIKHLAYINSMRDAYGTIFSGFQTPEYSHIKQTYQSYPFLQEVAKKFKDVSDLYMEVFGHTLGSTSGVIPQSEVDKIFSTMRGF
jgi:hypothetical protein